MYRLVALPWVLTVVVEVSSRLDSLEASQVLYSFFLLPTVWIPYDEVWGELSLTRLGLERMYLASEARRAGMAVLAVAVRKLFRNRLNQLKQPYTTFRYCQFFFRHGLRS